jgi:hypothetical protein
MLLLLQSAFQYSAALEQVTLNVSLPWTKIVLDLYFFCYESLFSIDHNISLVGFRRLAQLILQWFHFNRLCL